MDLLIDENNKLKKIIRTLDKRMKYLENRINSIVKNENNNYCYLCEMLCGIDEEKCDYNIFCQNYICNECIQNIKKDNSDKSMCKNINCKKWYCYNCLYKNDFLIKCYNCDNFLCDQHYYEADNPIQICVDCTNDSVMVNESDM
jgi:hypothetical protein